MKQENENYQHKLEDRIKLIVSEHLIRDCDFGAYITVTDVKLSGDFHHAYIYYTTLSSDVDGMKDKMDALVGRFRTYLAKALSRRRVPTVDFILDKLPEQVKGYDLKFSEIETRDEQLEQQRKSAEYIAGPEPYKEKKSHSFDDE
jgi:ribosome-binding factor A